MPIEVNGKSFETDEEGYLVDLSSWEKDLATVMAKEDNIELGDDHWEIINFLRESFSCSNAHTNTSIFPPFFVTRSNSSIAFFLFSTVDK